MKKLTFKPCRICGKPVTSIRRKDRKAFWYPRQCEICRKRSRNEPLRRKRISKAMKGMNHPRAKPLFSERIVIRRGIKYIQIKVNESGRWKYKHRYIMEKALSRQLKSTELVHHINQNTLDNRIGNLIILNTSQHNKRHHKLTRWSLNYGFCQKCKTTKRKHIGYGLCSRCYQRI